MTRREFPALQRLRRQFVAVCMTMVTLVLAGVVGGTYFTEQSSLYNMSMGVLHRVIWQDSAPYGTTVRPNTDVNIGGIVVQMPYFTVNLWTEGDGYRAYVTGGTYRSLENTEALTAILQECLALPDDEGTLQNYRLRYLRQDNGLYQKLAFVDLSLEDAMLQRMLINHLQIAAAALVVLAAVSLLLSRWVIRPVERAWRQQRQFLSDASHELKTPLTVILSNAELLQSTPPEQRPERWVDNILSEARQMRTLVEEMLTLARADSLAPTAVFSQVSLSDIAEDCGLLFEPVAYEAGHPLRLDDIAPGLTVHGDAQRLQRLISVLLDNAIKYAVPGGEITLRLERVGQKARLTVENPGDPIPPEQLRHLFERFYRADASRGEKSGFGLGLSIAAVIAQEHRGTLRAESDTASTRFLFTVPLDSGGRKPAKSGPSALEDTP